MIEILVTDNAFIDSRLISPLPYIIQFFDANNFTRDFYGNFPIDILITFVPKDVAHATHIFP